MKISEALTAGIKLYPEQTRRVYFNGSAACALGAIHAGAGLVVDFRQTISDQLFDAFPQMTDRVADPSTGNSDLQNWPLLAVINALNEFAGWTREQIRDWLVEKGY